MSNLLNKSAILAKKGLEPRKVNVPEWGGDVLYKPMSMAERREVRKKCSTTITDSKTGETKVDMDVEKLEVLTLIYCTLDPDNQDKTLFDIGDADLLENHMAAGGISTVAQKILAASGLAGNAMFRSEEDASE